MNKRLSCRDGKMTLFSAVNECVIKEKTQSGRGGNPAAVRKMTQEGVGKAKI